MLGAPSERRTGNLWRQQCVTWVCLASRRPAATVQIYVNENIIFENKPISFVRTTGDSVHTIHQDNRWQCSYYTSGQLVTVFILYIRTTGDSVHTIHQDNRWQCSYYTSGQPVTVFILYIRTTGDSVHTIHQDNRLQCSYYTRWEGQCHRSHQGRTHVGGGCYRAAAPLNRNFKHTNFVTGCYETFNVIHPATKISHWNQLVTGTSELWKIQQKTQQDALGETE